MLANVALSVLKTERIHGYRRSESVVRRGMAFEGAGELSITEDGALTLRKPTVRVDSAKFLTIAHPLLVAM